MNAEALMDLLQIIVLIFVFHENLQLIYANRGAVHLVFFAFAAACYLLSDLYWLVYDLLRPEMRMPFAANEIGEWAFFLLLAASVGSPKAHSFQNAKKEVLFTCFFVAASAGLWIGWSGEWMQDILTGLFYGYFLCTLVLRAKSEHAMPDRDWRMLGIVCAVLIAAQTAIFFVPDAAKRPLDLFCYIILFTVSAVFLVRAVLSQRKDEPGKSVCHAFAFFAWIETVLYMSSGGYYVMAMILSLFSFPLILLAYKKEVSAI